MQTFLNEEASHFSKQFRKYPVLWVIMFLWVAVPVILIPLAFFCNTTYTCSYNEENALISIGLMAGMSFLIFVIIPNTFRIFLNCLFTKPVESKNVRVKINSPLNSIQKEIPDPPKGPYPTHALKSFREFTTTA
jgi:hypothetical protein